VIEEFSLREEVKMIKKTDEQLHQDVLWELKWDSRVTETEVGVEVDAGIVTLTGTVDSFAKKIAAQEAAHRVQGVLDVANNVEVKIPNAYSLTDTEIAQSVRKVLQWDVLLPENIQSTVTNGWVTLEGTVNLLRERDDAGRSIRNLRGVRGLSNNLLVHFVSASTPKKEEDLKLLIEEVLERRAEREAERIDVAIHDGTVVLAGRVNSWQEKQAVLGAVSHAQGVKEVRDHLHIVIN
jgi:osmotically-inducible protein OsmY